jgi:hypothetical protein
MSFMGWLPSDSRFSAVTSPRVHAGQALKIIPEPAKMGTDLAGGSSEERVRLAPSSRPFPVRAAGDEAANPLVFLAGSPPRRGSSTDYIIKTISNSTNTQHSKE